LAAAHEGGRSRNHAAQPAGQADIDAELGAAVYFLAYFEHSPVASAKSETVNQTLGEPIKRKLRQARWARMASLAWRMREFDASKSSLCRVPH
jgi:hypothetical protein